MTIYTSAHFNNEEDFKFSAGMRHSEYTGNDYMVIDIDKLTIYLTPDQAQQLASHILSQLQAHRANELYKIQTEYALMEGEK